MSLDHDVEEIEVEGLVEEEAGYRSLEKKAQSGAFYVALFTVLADAPEAGEQHCVQPHVCA